MFTRGWRADAELLRDEQAANAVLDQVSVDLRWKVPHGFLQPMEDLPASFVWECVNRVADVQVFISHFTNCLISSAPNIDDSSKYLQASPLRIDVQYRAFHARIDGRNSPSR